MATIKPAEVSAILKEQLTGFEGKASLFLTYGMYEHALFYYDNALEIEPENHILLKDKAFTLAQLGKLDDAKLHYELANEFKNK